METINDIVREVAEEMLNTSMQAITAERIHGWATRLGATSKESLQVGNAAKMREVLDEIRVAAMSDYEWDADYLIEKCNAALSAPPRNCDLPNVIEDPHKAWLADKDNWNDLSDPIKDIDEWLLAEAKGETK